MNHIYSNTSMNELILCLKLKEKPWKYFTLCIITVMSWTTDKFSLKLANWERSVISKQSLKVVPIRLLAQMVKLIGSHIQLMKMDFIQLSVIFCFANYRINAILYFLFSGTGAGGIRAGQDAQIDPNALESLIG